MAGAGSVGIVGRYVHGLHRGDGPLRGRGDPLLQARPSPWPRSADSPTAEGHASQQGRYFAPRLGETEDVVDEQQHVGPGRVAEVFGHGQAGEATRKRTPGGSFIWPKTMQVCSMTLRPVLTDLRFPAFRARGRCPSRVRSPTPAKHRVTAVRAGDTSDQFGQNHGLAQPGAAEQTGLAAADERRQKVDHLDAGLEDFGLGRKVGHLGGVAVDGPVLVGLDRTPGCRWSRR